MSAWDDRWDPYGLRADDPHFEECPKFDPSSDVFDVYPCCCDDIGAELKDLNDQMLVDQMREEAKR